jgi:peptide subunit release factor 1 (eRF1)
VVVYACGPLKLFEVIAVPRVHRSRLGVDASAQVRELAALDDEVGRILAVVLDRTAARFFEVTAFGVDELPGLRADSTRGGRFRGDQDGPGWGEHAYNNRMRTERARHLDLAARRLFTLDRERRATGVVIGGMGGDPAALRPFLHPYLDGRVLGEIRTNPKEATAASVREAVLDAREAHERAAERSNARQLTELLGQRMAVTGVGESLRALRRGQVRTLLVDPDASEPGWRAEATGRLALREIELRDEGDLAPVLDVVDDAIEDALRQQAVVDVVYDPEARRGIDGLAAFLRFR